MVGGGPGGSTTAWRLAPAGVRPLLLDAAVFPRVKICAGWVTPVALADVEIEPETYPHTIQPFTACRLAFAGTRHETRWRAPGQLRHPAPRVRPPPARARGRGRSRRPLRRARGRGHRERDWRAGDDRARRATRPPSSSAPAATTAPWRGRSARSPSARRSSSPRRARRGCPRRRSPALARFMDAPELYVEPDLRGYGWYFPKGDWVNIGIGCTGGGRRQPAPAARRAASQALRASGRLPDGAADRAVQGPRVRRAAPGAATPRRLAASAWSATRPAWPAT